MDTYDIIIIGAGPAGSTAAYYAARSGARVALVDRQTFPRDKVCGDGAASLILARLEAMGLAGWVQEHGFNAPEELLFSSPNGDAVRFRPDPPGPGVCYGRVIPRLQLDEALVRQAVAAGATLLEGVNLAGADRDTPGRMVVRGTSNGRTSLRLAAPLLITADGAHASFTRKLGLVKSGPDLVAVRAYFEDVRGGDGLLEFHYDAVLSPGYAWIFPLTGGRANVGLGTFVSRSRARGVNLKQELDRFIRQNPYAAARLGQARLVGPVRGHPLRSRMDSVTPVADNILVAGEAAGLVNPLNGEGIGTAMLSGELAARHGLAALEAGDLSTGALRPYAVDLQQQIGRRHAVFRLLQRIIAWPPALNRVVRRARHDRHFAQTLFEVIIELRHPADLLKPGFLWPWLVG